MARVRENETDKLRLRNEETGQLHIVAKVRYAKHSEPFTILFREEMVALLSGVGSTMSGSEWKLFLYLLAQMDFGNSIERHIKELAEGLVCDRSSVSRALPRLEELGLIRRDDAVGNRPRRIVVDPHVAFRGTVKQRDEVMRQGWS